MSILNIFKKQPINFFSIVDAMTAKSLKLRIGASTEFKIPNGYSPAGVIETVKNEIPEDTLGFFTFSVDQISQVITIRRNASEAQILRAAVRTGAAKPVAIQQPDLDTYTYNLNSGVTLEEIDDAL